MATTAITRKWLPLAEQEIAAHGGMTHMSIITHAHLNETTANTAQDIVAGAIPEGCYVHKLKRYVKKPFRDKSDRAFNSITAAVGDSALATTFLAAGQVGRNAGRAYNDGVTTVDSTTVTSATATFIAGDVGDRIMGTGIPDGATIASRNSGTSIELSAAATASGTGVTLFLPDREPAIAGGEPGTLMNTATGPYTADDTVIVRFTPAPTSKALNDIDEGELHIYAQILDVSDLAETHGGGG